jgi:putative flippase GtrA
MPVIDKTLFRFIIVGITNTIVGSGLMFVLYNLFNAGYWTASVSNYIVGSILSFFLNKYFTFAIKEWTLFMVIGFVMNVAISYFVAYGLARPAMGYLLKNSPAKIRENTALFAGMCLFTLLNYAGQRFIVFKVKTGK